MAKQIRLNVSDEELRAALREDERWLNFKAEFDELKASHPERLKAFHESKVYAKTRAKIERFKERIEVAEQDLANKRDWYLDPGGRLGRLRVEMQRREIEIAYRIEAARARKEKRRIGR